MATTTGMQASPLPPLPPGANPRPLRRWIALGMLAILLSSLIAYYFTSNRLPREIRIATAAKGGLYHRAGEILAANLQKRTGRTVRLIETKGSLDNHTLLSKGDADLAVFQEGTAPFEGLSPLTPLFPEVVLVIVRKDTNVKSIRDLFGRAVALGPEGSGMRVSAQRLLDHYGVDPKSLKESERYFGDLATEPKLDAAIVTTGLINPDLAKLLKSGQFELLTDIDAEALKIHHPFFRCVTIPRGTFNEQPTMPSVPVEALSTSALLVSSSEAPAVLVQEAMEAVYETDMGLKLPILIPLKEAAERPLAAQHPAARNYFDPYEGLGILANFMESISAAKELMFAIGAGVYLLWDRYRRKQEAAVEREVMRQKEVLDAMLMETVEIEKAHYLTTDPEKLQKYLKDVSEIKFKALRELTSERLRGDGLFSIFLNQCNGLAREIDAKLERVTAAERKLSEVDG